MNLRSIRWIILLFLPGVQFAQEGMHSLLVAHAVNAEGSKANFRQTIYSYHFLNGTYTGRDEIMSFDGKKNGRDYVRTDKGDNFLYKDRYVITGIGNIIDIVDKKVLFDGKANLVKISNDSVIYYTNDAFKGKFYSVYNFKTHTYSEVTNLLFKAKTGKEVEFDKTVTPFKINYYPQGKPNVELIQDAGFGPLRRSDSKYTADPPVFWLNDSLFVYVNFNKANTEAAFYQVNIETHLFNLLGTSTIIPDTRGASLKRLSSNELVMNYGYMDVIVNLEKKTITIPLESKAVNGFSYLYKAGPKGRVILYHGKEIGQFFFNSGNFACAENCVGLVKELIVGEESYQQGLKIWIKSKNTWLNVDAEEVLSFIGWVNW
ncbi:MAG: hypothetical protein PSX36_08040 [bacterium]|nr:hypothetical protein [bacterium]